MTRTRQTLPAGALDATDRAILNALQEGFPLTPRPYDDAGAALVSSTGNSKTASAAQRRGLLSTDARKEIFEVMTFALGVVSGCAECYRNY